MGATEGFKMFQLIQLFNEYEKESGLDLSRYSYTDNQYDLECKLDKHSELKPFIKRLIENEKIDLGTRNPLFLTKLVGGHEKQIPYSFYEEMLIRLALSDTPIEDLISYLDLSKS